MCLGTVMLMYVHNHAWAQQMCRMWAQMYVGTNVSGHCYVVTVVWAQSCMGTNVMEPDLVKVTSGYSIWSDQLTIQ